MTDFQKEILSLLKAALHETEPTGVDLKDLGKIYQFAEAQQMMGALYYGLLGVLYRASRQPALHGALLRISGSRRGTDGGVGCHSLCL